ncbi:hypothetical protein AVEN_238105-1 [Araneus ventricosus]|uniref:Uncharacterized protein n=1 Tax=Araneus ventricosus TaxID=182803 RepID=A0A4Y2GEK2_ARAVE|nr:hypothetical protein AVEN_238105-1 [Araneus ventricosus]
MHRLVATCSIRIANLVEAGALINWIPRRECLRTVNIGSGCCNQSFVCCAFRLLCVTLKNCLVMLVGNDSDPGNSGLQGYLVFSWMLCWFNVCPANTKSLRLLNEFLIIFLFSWRGSLAFFMEMEEGLKALAETFFVFDE